MKHNGIMVKVVYMQHLKSKADKTDKCNFKSVGRAAFSLFWFLLHHPVGEAHPEVQEI